MALQTARRNAYSKLLCILFGFILLLQTLHKHDYINLNINGYNLVNYCTDPDAARDDEQLADFDHPARPQTTKASAMLELTGGGLFAKKRAPIVLLRDEIGKPETKTGSCESAVDGRRLNSFYRLCFYLAVVCICYTFICQSWEMYILSAPYELDVAEFGRYFIDESRDPLAHVAVNRTVSAMTLLEEWIPCDKGGEWSPKKCAPQADVAMIIPYRDREVHLRVFLQHMHPYLQRQRLHYRIFVVHQTKGAPFNRAKLFNVGFREASKFANFSCFVFHDVDLLPVTAGVPYNCSQKGPTHLIAAMDKFRWTIPYGSYFGGACALTRAQFEQMNGFSNVYWGWGGEDDDAWTRIYVSSQRSQRVPKPIGHFSMIRHGRDSGNHPVGPDHFALLRRTKHVWRTDGLNSLSYSVQGEVIEHKLYTEVHADLHYELEMAKTSTESSKTSSTTSALATSST